MRSPRRYAKKVKSATKKKYLPFIFEIQDLLYELLRDKHVELLNKLEKMVKCDCFFAHRAVCLNKNCKVKSVTKYQLKANISIDCKFGMREPGLSVAAKSKAIRSKARKNTKDRIPVYSG
jgi:hypothetical protein